MLKLIVSSVAGLLAVYLIVDAPPPLTDADTAAREIPIEVAFDILDKENATVRALYTREIVGAGKRIGLRFDEDWKDEAVVAGPLPALFLRETAMSLERSPVQLGLFLGSDYPIEQANSFTGKQLEIFSLIRSDGQRRVFFETDTSRHTAMYPDLAVADACVDCHNEHGSSPKTDWALGDAMGATTWSYPEGRVSVETLFEMLARLREAVEHTYALYLEEVRQLDAPPTLADQWPRDGYYLPDLETFMSEVQSRTSPATIRSIMSIIDSPERPSIEADFGAE